MFRKANITNTTEPCDPENGSTEYTKNDENVPQTLSRELGTSLVAENDENVPQPSLVAEMIISTTATEPCDPENGSTENTAKSTEIILDCGK